MCSITLQLQYHDLATLQALELSPSPMPELPRPQPQSSQQRSEPRHLLGEVETHWPWWIAWPQESSSGVSSFCSCRFFKDFPADNAIHHPVLHKSLYCKGQPHATERDLSRICFKRKVLVMTLLKNLVSWIHRLKSEKLSPKNPRVEDYHVWGPWLIKAPNSQEKITHPLAVNRCHSSLLWCQGSQ